MKKKSIMQTYGLLICMLAGIVGGCIVGAMFPSIKNADGDVVSAGATVLKPIGQIFINLMFCIVVPMVFASIAGAVANMRSRKRAGKIMASTIITFVVTGAIAALIMIVLMKLIPPVLVPWKDIPAGTVDEQKSIADLVVSFFTAEDFVGLLSRRSMLPLIVFSLIFGFGVNLNGGPDSLVGKFLNDLSNCMMKVVQIVTYYAPIAFFGFFADLVATYGADIAKGYGRALVVYYPLCFIYVFTAFPLFARFGGGKGAVGEMFRHILRPAVTSLGTCSSVATIPTNMEVARETGVPEDVSEIVLPLGATMHMDGSCFSCVLKIAFLFGVFGKPFTGIGTFVEVIVVAVLSSVGMSGIPGGGYIGEFIMCSIFFPNQLELAYPIAITIGNLVDPPATMINSSGDYVVSYIVARFVDGKDWLQKVFAQRAKSEK
ncbi:MAG: dicarboxylate/amino acid:cation symporter [Oscillibacter sp.]|jgi:Na+/H+-dicarboxylate symporter|nr:dicarboxylate/amino acid:cation symporter [Oscillibacter sp.]